MLELKSKIKIIPPNTLNGTVSIITSWMNKTIKVCSHN